MDVRDLETANPQDARGTGLVIGQGHGFAGLDQDVIERTASILGRCETDLIPVVKGEPASLRRRRILENDLVRRGRSTGAEDRLARLQPDEGDQAEPALRQSQLGIPSVGPFRMFFGQSGHGGLRG